MAIFAFFFTIVSYQYSSTKCEKGPVRVSFIRSLGLGVVDLAFFYFLLCEPYLGCCVIIS
ncbi:unnamed protein product [Tuber melanosporum]|uniref:(Perigord truffle) hypothetical protein n=1 Tax=Tuber melanosporum (strain Mel28) TaxID=656061 RepID=D5G9Y5_TUBMM|nr:uncharacterized protein GSTUM_00003450001 [Tuber melanosporum]CAZ81328.1 unnamed protein product [Tuber melanosporum]